jgi:hypothetical protein
MPTPPSPATPVDEPEEVLALRGWLQEHGGFMHPVVRFLAGSVLLGFKDVSILINRSTVPAGLSAIAAAPLPPDTTVVSCPFALAITSSLSRTALIRVVGDTKPDTLANWNSRQLICTYICLHWVIEKARSLIIAISLYIGLLSAVPGLADFSHIFRF